MKMLIIAILVSSCATIPHGKYAGFFLTGHESMALENKCQIAGYSKEQYVEFVMPQVGYSDCEISKIKGFKKSFRITCKSPTLAVYIHSEDYANCHMVHNKLATK